MLCLSNYNIINDCKIGTVHISEKNVLIRDEELVNKLECYTYPLIHSMMVYHYTSKEVCDNIRMTKIFRLYSILKRYGE